MLLYMYSKRGNDMNTQEIIKEIRKSGKVAIEMSGTEMEILVDKGDLIQMIKNQAGHEFEIYGREGYRCVFFRSIW